MEPLHKSFVVGDPAYGKEKIWVKRTEHKHASPVTASILAASITWWKKQGGDGKKKKKSVLN